MTIGIIPSPEKTKGGVIIPRFRLYRRSAEHAHDAIEVIAECEEWDAKEIYQALMDTRDGIFTKRPIISRNPLALGVVIGENPDVKISGERPFAPPRFGDVVLFNQSVSTDWFTFFKLPCDTRGSDSFLMSDLSGERWLTVPRNSEVVVAHAETVIGVAFRYEEFAAKREQRH